MRIKPRASISALLILFLLAGMGILILSVLGLSEERHLTMYMMLLSFSIFFLLGTFFSYLFLRKGETLGEQSDEKMNSRFFNRILQISFFVILILIAYVLLEALYMKPLEYYLLVAVGAALIAIQIFYLDKSNKKNVLFILLLEIIPLSLITLGSSLVINPYLVGPDTPWHFHNIQRILETSYLVPASFHYYYYPFHHLSQSIGQLILTPGYASFNMVNLIASMTSVPLAYLVGRDLFSDEKAGLYSSLLLSVSTSLIFLMANTSKIGGVALFLLCLWTLIKMRSSGNSKWLYLFWLPAIGVFFWHTEASIALLLLITALVISEALASKENGSIVKKGQESRNMLILYSVAFIGYLAYVHVSLFSSIVQSIFMEIGPPRLVQDLALLTIDSNLFIEFLISYLGISSLLFFFPFLMLRSSILRDKGTSAISILIGLLCLLPLIGIVGVGLGMFPARNITYLAIVLALFSGGGIAILIGRGTNIRPLLNQKSKLFILTVFIIAFALSSTTSYLNYDNNDLFSQNIPVQTVYTTESNLASHGFLSATPEDARIVGYYDTLRFTTDPVRGFFGLGDREVVLFPNFEYESFFVIEGHALQRLNWKATVWGQEISSVLAEGNGLYCSGGLSVYYR